MMPVARAVIVLVCGVCCLAAAPANIRIASLNLAKQWNPSVVEEIRKQADLRRADILLLQEVVDGEQGHVAPAVASMLGLQVVFAKAFRLNEQFDEGLAILSRYPVSARKVLPLTHNSLHFHTRIRIALAATVESPMGAIRVVDTHLDNRINEEEKRAQLEGIWEETGRYAGRFIVGGDFNTGNFLWISHVLPLPGLQDQRGLVERDMKQHGFTTPLGAGPATLHFPGLKLDWIYLRGLRALDSGVTPIGFSDHNSVWVTVS
jgi:endonuclease/exonuclease/phosphatase family metal-dependent hydrolase